MRSTGRSDGSLSNLNVIILRRNKARGEIVDDLKTMTEDSSESAFWIDDHLKRVLKKLVYSFIDAENQLYGLQIRKKRLESFNSDGKVPSGLKINVVAKGQRVQSLLPLLRRWTTKNSKQRNGAKKKRRISTLLSSLGENLSRLVLLR